MENIITLTINGVTQHLEPTKYEIGDKAEDLIMINGAWHRNINQITPVVVIEPAQPKEINFTTHDGVEITDPNTLLYVSHKKFNTSIITADKISSNTHNIHFSTEEARDKFIGLNKPIFISLQNIFDLKEPNLNAVHMTDIIKYFKQKTKTYYDR